MARRAPQRHDARRGTLLRRVAVIAALLVGVVLIVYPLVGNAVYEWRAQRVVATYDEEVASAGERQVDEEFAVASAYNEALSEADVVLTDPFDPNTVSDAPQSYESIFNLAGDGVMGYLEIPSIDVNLPIYHGTASDVLQEGVGHMANTSLPTGEAGTHAVFAGHTGLPNAKILTDLPQLEEGDVFYLNILGRTLAYEVDQISIVEPSDSRELAVVEGKEYVTLLTCYPYGLNTERLLVRGEGIPCDQARAQEGDAEGMSVWESEYLRAILLCLAIYVPLTIIVILVARRRRQRDA